MPELVGVVFASDPPEPDRAGDPADAAGGSHPIGQAIDALIDAGVTEVIVWTPSPDRVRDALRGRRFRRRRHIRAWNPANGHAQAFLRMHDRLETAGVLVADGARAPAAPLIVPAESSNCIYYVDADPAQGGQVDLIEIAYADGRNPHQFAVRAVGDGGQYPHIGFTFFPLALIETIQVMGVERELARLGRHAGLTRMLHRVRRKSRGDQLSDAKGLTLSDLATRYLALGKLTAIKV